MLRRPAVALLATCLAASLVPAARLEACTCTGEPTFEQQFAAASAVYTGRVTAIQPAGDGYHMIVTLTPLLRWKGGLSNPEILATGENEGVCGFAFQVGVEYLIYAFPYSISGQPIPFTHLCSRTGLAKGHPDFPSLGAPLIPTPIRPRTWGGVKSAWR